MAQIVKLKRTSVQGKVPTISNVELGELAINTYDGRIFFEKSSSVESIQEILVTNTGRAITGSLNLNGSITSSGVLVSANIMPNADNTLSLGSSTQRFQLNGGTPVTVDGSGTANTLTRFQSATTVEDSNIVSSDTATTLTHSNNGNIIFTVSGSNGELFTVTDSNSGNLLEVNDTSGIDVFTVSATGDVSASGAITASGITGLTSLTVNGNIYGTSFNGTGLLSGSITNQLPSGVVSSSAFSSPSQGTIRATINGTQTNVDTGLQTGDSPQFTNLTLTGNLTVQGTTTTENSQQVNIGDNIINLNYGGSSTTGGIYVKDGTGASTTSGSLLWDATNDYWKLGKLGSESEVITTSNIVTNLPNGSVSGSSQVFSDISGDITIASNGTAAIGNGVIVNADINSSAAIASSKIDYDGTGIVSQSAQITGISNSQIDSSAAIDSSKINYNGTGILSGSTQVTGIQFSQIDPDSIILSTEPWPANDARLTTPGAIDKRFDTKGLFSGSAQVTVDMTNIDAGALLDSTEAWISVDSRITTPAAIDKRIDDKGVISGSSQVFSDITGDITINSGGTSTISNGVIVNADINTSAAIDSSKINYDGTGIVSGSQQVVSSLLNQTVNFGTGQVTASYFSGDGSGLTNVTATISENATVTGSFSNASSFTINHNFNSKNVIVSVYDNNDSQIIPQEITLSDNDNVDITLSAAQSGFVVVAKGGHIVSGSANDASNLNGQPATYYLDYTNFNNVPSGIVSGSSQITDLTTHKETVSGNTSYAVTHNLNEQYPIVQAWNTSTSQQVIPESITTNSVNQVTVTFVANFAGVIIVKK